MIRRGFLEVDPALLSWVLGTCKVTPGILMSATGNAWQWRGVEGATCSTTFLQAAAALTGEGPLKRSRWWANVLHAGSEHRPHKHDGQWAFVYHLTEGAALRFKDANFPATPGQLIVFHSDLEHWTDPITEGERVTIAGNLFFKRGPK